jgi:hypothetical protein
MKDKYEYTDERGAHLHTLNGIPLIGTSTVCKIIGGDKTGGLIWWASGKAVEKLGWTPSKIKKDGRYVEAIREDRLLPASIEHIKIKNMNTLEYLELLDDAYKAHDTSKRDSAKKGKKRHELLEKYVKECIASGGAPIFNTNETIQSFIDWSLLNVSQFLWSELHCYSKKLWTGGIADVGWRDNDGTIVAGDFKSSKEAYFDQFIQIAGYDIALAENGGFTPKGEHIFTLEKPIERYCVVPFGNEKLTPETIHNTDYYKSGFGSALALHSLSLTFKP